MSVHAKLYFYRLLGYFCGGVGFIMAPYFVFKLTGSVTMAALLLIIEFIPQFLMYITGGAIVNHFTPRLTHISIEGIRLFAISSLLFSIATETVWAIFLASALMSLTGCVFQVITETLVYQHWGEKDASKGYGAMNSAALLGKVISSVVAVLIVDHMVVLSITVGVQWLLLMLVAFWSRDIYNQKVSKPEVLLPLAVFMKRNAVKAMKSVSASQLKLAFMSVSLYLPSTALVSFLPFVMADQLNMANLTSSQLAMARLAIQVSTMVSSFVVLTLISKSIAKPSSLAMMAVVSTQLVLACVLLGSNQMAIWVLVAITSVYFLYSPWSKSTRQSMMQGSPEMRRSVTGVLIGIESSSVMLAAVIVATFNNDLTAVMSAISLLIVVSSIIWLVDVRKRSSATLNLVNKGMKHGNV